MNFDLGSKNISDILTEVSGMDDFIKKSSMLDFHVHALEEELHKIEAFKRELPHCMHLLKHGPFLSLSSLYVSSLSHLLTFVLILFTLQ